MKEKVNIMCLYWVGNFRNRDFHHQDIVRLWKSVRKHIDRPFDFYVLTNCSELMDGKITRSYFREDNPYDWNIIPLEYNWPGWWSKMELHRPDLPPGRTLYMDLDSHVISNLQPILDYPGDLVMFGTRIPKRKWPRLESQKWVCRYQAATMLFDSGTECMRGVYHLFSRDPEKWMNVYRSDQDVMGDWIPNQPTFPDKWMMKLDGVRNYERPPEGVIIVTGQTKDGLFRKTDKIPWFEKTARL